MADANTLTGWLIIAIGLYSAAAGFGMALSPDRFQRMFADIEASPGINFVTGLLVFSIGATILLVHPTSAHWPGILVAIMGWGALIEGMLFLAVPQVMWAIAKPFLKANTRLWGIIALVFGLALVALGWCEVQNPPLPLV
jgi:threonine/homoserine/homoserine lactone efflux protein